MRCVELSLRYVRSVGGWLRDQVIALSRLCIRMRRGLSIGFSAVVILVGMGLVKESFSYVREAEDSAVRAQVNAFLSNRGFALQQIDVLGAKFVSNESIARAAGVLPGQAISAVDVQGVRERVKGVVGVKDVSVQVLLPDVMQIHITEFEPFAYHQNRDTLSLVSRAGDVVQMNPERGLPYLYVVGEGGEKHIEALDELLQAAPDVRARLYAALWHGERRWTLRLENGLDILLPEQVGAQDIRRLEDLQSKYRLLDKQITRLDLRVPGQVLVRRGSVDVIGARVDAQMGGFVAEETFDVLPPQRQFGSEL